MYKSREKTIKMLLLLGNLTDHAKSISKTTRGVLD